MSEIAFIMFILVGLGISQLIESRTPARDMDYEEEEKK
jgi:hypothetical protein